MLYLWVLYQKEAKVFLAGKPKLDQKLKIANAIFFKKKRFFVIST